MPTKTTAKKTAKKASTKKSPVRSATRTTVKRAPARANEMKSFVPSRESEPFFTFRITHQTLYWLALSTIVLALGLWVVTINDKVQRIYDEIDRTTNDEQSMVVPSKQ